MYMAGRRRTASSPSSTLMLVESYTSLCTAPPSFAIFCLLGILWGRSDAHRHHYVPILIGHAFARRPELAGALLIFQFEGDLVLCDHAQKVEQVLGVEANLQVWSLILAIDALFAFTHLHR